MKLLSSLLIACVLSTAAWAQLADGSVAPNWTLTDIDGNTHTLYDYIDQGKTVVLDFGATWCAPCWSYHQSGALDYFWNTKGPNGTDESMVFWIESDLTTGWQDLIGATGASQGDWVSSTPYPIIDVTTSAVPDAYNVNYYPTLYKVCTDYKVYEVGQVPGTTWENWIQSCTMEASLVNVWGTTCYGFGQGGAEVTGSGGYGSISYSWSNGQNGPILNGVEAGSFTCTAEDANGREIVIGGILVEGPGTPISMTNSMITDLLCFGDQSGSISVTAQGGNGGFTYQWSNGATGAIASNLPGGSYDVTIVDANGCDSEPYSFFVNEPPPVEFTYTAVDAHCDQNDGIIFVDPTGGTGPYDLFADGGTVNNVLFQVDDLFGGLYTLDVVDANGCVETQSINIENIPGPELFMPGTQEITCANPTVVLAPEVEYENLFDLVFQWTTTDGNIVEGAFDQQCVVSQPGTYLLTVEDVLYGCTVFDQVVVTGDVDIPQVTAGEDQALTCDSQSLVVSASINNLPQEFVIEWSTDSGNIVSGQGTAEITVDAPGEYVVQVINTANGCAGLDIVVVHDERSYPEAGFMFEKDFLAVQFTSGATGDDINHAWDFGDGTQSTEANPLHVFPFTGTYHVCLTVTNGCGSAVHCFDIDVEQEASAIQISATAQHVTCHGDANGSIQIDVVGGTGVYTYEWIGPNGFTSAGEDLTGLPAGAYILTVLDDGGNQTQIQVVITEPEPLSLSIGQSLGFMGPVLSASVSGGTPEYSYLWSNGATTPVLENVPSGSYTVQVTDANGCLIGSETIRVINPNDIAAISDDFYIEVSGNPSSQPLTIRLVGTTDNLSSEVSYRIVNVAGQVIAAGQWHGDQTTVDLRDQMPGIYFLVSMHADGLISTERIFIPN